LRWLTNRNKERKEKNDLAETWKPIAFDKTENLNLRVQRLDEDAYRVIESIQTILSMKQQQASLDIAASAEIQGIVLVIFTIITILFAPISFVAVLLTIPDKDTRINSDGGRLSYSMVTAELTTLFLLTVGYLLLTSSGRKWLQRIRTFGRGKGGASPPRLRKGTIDYLKTAQNKLIISKDPESQYYENSLSDS